MGRGLAAQAQLRGGDGIGGQPAHGGGGGLQIWVGPDGAGTVVATGALDSAGCPGDQLALPGGMKSRLPE